MKKLKLFSVLVFLSISGVGQSLGNYTFDTDSMFLNNKYIVYPDGSNYLLFGTDDTYHSNWAGIKFPKLTNQRIDNGGDYSAVTNQWVKNLFGNFSFDTDSLLHDGNNMLYPDANDYINIGHDNSWSGIRFLNLSNQKIDDGGDSSAVTAGWVKNEIHDSLVLYKPTGLEEITEGGNTGWRLIGRDSSDYADIGRGAIDFSVSNGYQNPGAIGINSFCIGANNWATGGSSAAFGYNTRASGYISFVIGEFSRADGMASFAGGNGYHHEGYPASTGWGSFTFQRVWYNNGPRGAGARSSAVLGGTDNDIESGAWYSGILGGDNGKINPNAQRSIILGGEDITAYNANTVYVPYLNLAYTPHSGSLSDSILVYDPSDSTVKMIDPALFLVDNQIMPKVSDWITGGTVAENGVDLRDSLATYDGDIYWDTDLIFDSCSFGDRNIFIESGRLLKFTSDVYGTGTNIKAGNHKIFYIGIANQLKGVWNIDEVNSYWFGLDNRDTALLAMKEAAYFAGLTTGNVLAIHDTIELNDTTLNLYVNDGFVLDGKYKVIRSNTTDYITGQALVEIMPYTSEAYSNDWTRTSPNWIKLSTTIDTAVLRYENYISLVSISGLEAGDLLAFEITSTDWDFYEISEVSASGVWVTTDIIRDYSVSTTVNAFYTVKDVTIKDLIFETDTAFAAGLVVNYANIVNITNVKARRTITDIGGLGSNKRFDGITVRRCWNYLIDNCRADYCTYGILVVYSGLGTVSNSITNSGWHGFEATDGSKDMTFENCEGTNAHFTFRFHEETTNVTLRNVQSFGGEALKFSGVKMILDGFYFRGNPNSTGRFGGVWDSNLNILLIDGSFDVQDSILINNGVIEGNYDGSSSATLVKHSIDLERNIFYDNVDFIIGNNIAGLETDGSLYEEFKDCNFIWLDQTNSELGVFLDHYNITSGTPEVVFDGCNFINTPHNGFYPKFPDTIGNSIVFLKYSNFKGTGTTSTDPITMKGSDNGTVYFIGNEIYTSAMGHWVDAAYYQPDLFISGNKFFTDLTDNYAFDLVDDTISVLGLSNNQMLNNTDVIINPDDSPSIDTLTVEYAEKPIYYGDLTIGAITISGTDGTNGQVLTTDGSGNVTFEDAGGGGTTILTAYKSTATSRASTTTFTDDPHLEIAVGASSVYLFEAYILYDAGSSEDIKVRVHKKSGLSNADLRYGIQQDRLDAFQYIFDSQQTGFGYGVGTYKGMYFSGRVTTDESGTINIQWAQNVSGVNNTTLNIGSYIKMIKLN